MRKILRLSSDHKGQTNPPSSVKNNYLHHLRWCHQLGKSLNHLYSGKSLESTTRKFRFPVDLVSLNSLSTFTQTLRGQISYKDYLGNYTQCHIILQMLKKRRHGPNVSKEKLSPREWQSFGGHSECDHYDHRRQYSTVVSRGWSPLTCEPNPACSLFLYVPQDWILHFLIYNSLKKKATKIISSIKPRISKHLPVYRNCCRQISGYTLMPS